MDFWFSLRKRNSNPNIKLNSASPNSNLRKMGRQGYSMMKLLGVQGKKVDIIPTTKGMNLTELYSKKGDCRGKYMGTILYDKKWKLHVLVDLDNKMQMSLFERSV